MRLLLVRPKLLIFKNRLLLGRKSRNQLGRDFVLFLFSAGVMWSIYFGCTEALIALRKHSELFYLPPSHPLGLLLMFTMVMLLFSNAVAAYGSFFQARDLDLILAAPVDKPSLFIGRFSEVFFSSSWMVLVFIAPALLAFGTYYNATIEFSLISLMVLLPYLIIPTAISSAVVCILARLFPVNRTKEILLLAGLTVLIIMYVAAQQLIPREEKFFDINEALKIISMLTVPNSTWLPSHWGAMILGNALEDSGKPSLIYVIGIYSIAMALMALAYLCFRFTHQEAYTLAKNSRQRCGNGSVAWGYRLTLPWAFLGRQGRALIAKEYRCFSRDIAQAVQLLLLLSLCLIYLYNFRILNSIRGLPEATRIWWQAFLLISNSGMGAFVVTAVCSRFAFPTVSLEGQAFWVIQSAPVKTMDFLRAKFWCWYVPIGSISSVLFISGALAIDARWEVVLINGIACWIVSYGIVGLAVGLGAVFSHFDWESSSQLAASFGSLVFMLTSTILILINLIPVAVLVALTSFKNLGYHISDYEWLVASLSATFLFSYINYLAKKWALEAGQRSLDTKAK